MALSWRVRSRPKRLTTASVSMFRETLFRNTRGPKESGSRLSFSCRYHAWTFNG